MRIAIHQPSFLPWFPFFEKMEQADIFVILTECQFEKNGFTNRAKINGKWWTKPVRHGLVRIIDKYYDDGQSLLDVNLANITAIARILGIDTNKIRFDFPTPLKGTDRLVEICQMYKCDEYLSNALAQNKYLEVGKLKAAGIKFLPFKTNYPKHVFEMFEEYGVPKTINILKNGKS